MTLEECYDLMQGDYKDVMQRLMRESFVERFLFKFLGSADLENLKASLEAEDYAEAFRFAHSLKGECLNLGISRLQHSSSELCEALRGGKPQTDISGILQAVEEDYIMTKDAIRRLQEEKQA